MAYRDGKLRHWGEIRDPVVHTGALPLWICGIARDDGRKQSGRIQPTKKLIEQVAMKARNISLRQLQAFTSVAELGKFRLAAEHIGATQSGVTMLIKELEHQLGARLFDRHTRMIGLTHAGRLFLPIARQVIGQIGSAVDTIDDLSHLRSGKVTVASAIVLASTIVPEVIARFSHQHPGIKVSLLDVSEEHIRDLLLDGTADIGVGTSRAIESKIREQRLFSDRLAVFCNTDHAFAERQRVRWMDLQGQKLVGFASDNPIQAIINRVLDENQIVTERAFSVNFSTTMLALIDLGQGICIAPEHSLRLSVPGGTVVRPLVEPELRRDVVASTLREHTLSTSASSLLDTLISTATSKYR